MVARTVSSLKPINDLLLSTQTTLLEHLMLLALQSQNKITQIFTKIFREHEMRTRPEVNTFYEDIRTSLEPRSDITIESQLSSTCPRNLAASTVKFFRDIFPVAYHKVIKFDGKQLTPEYELCLRDAYDTVKPFGDVPKQMGENLLKNLEATRALMHAMTYGALVLTSSANLLRKSGDDRCSDILFKAAGCARCQGLNARPCKNYCLNVVRGCLGYLVELDGPWSSYVDDLGRLARSDSSESTLLNLESKISAAIMHAMENVVSLQEKVQKECGPPTVLDTPLYNPHSAHPRRDVHREAPHFTQMLQFLASLTEKRRIFYKLSDRICDDPDLSHSNNTDCWTGDKIGEYTKTLVTSAEKNHQKFNPEVNVKNFIYTEFTTLGGRLETARQWLANTYLPGDVLLSDAAVGYDEDAQEGSGKDRYAGDDPDYDREGSGAGSGDGRIDDDSYSRTRQGSETPKTGAASLTSPAALLTLLLCIITRSIT